ncbi:hypothetical protein ACFOLF_12030 [Paenibacillus sepulcri]|uniref:YqzN/YkzM domain-containing protein n=1 Tax=Paenibacillus sepulcri TaxID=359917 RepID=A0ABS7C774_9BACL|nr:hypothetical protein [Paenibacillus sepulcri]
MNGNMTNDPPAALTFSKGKLLKSARFTPLERDVLNGALEDAGRYSIEEAREHINQFMKQEVR